jgi:hypothetical protein
VICQAVVPLQDDVANAIIGVERELGKAIHSHHSLWHILRSQLGETADRDCIAAGELGSAPSLGHDLFAGRQFLNGVGCPEALLQLFPRCAHPRQKIPRRPSGARPG